METDKADLCKPAEERIHGVVDNPKKHSNHVLFALHMFHPIPLWKRVTTGTGTGSSGEECVSGLS